MAYKFQVGAAEMGGALTQEGALVVESTISGSGQVSGASVAVDGKVAGSELSSSAALHGNLSADSLRDRDTGDLSEGSNLYYTTARWDTKMAAADSGDLSEGSNLYYTTARWDTKMAAADTGDLSEGSNLYHTTARARAAVSVTDAGGDGSMAYDNGTGVITYTGPSAAEVRAHMTAGEMLQVASGEFSIIDSAFSGSSQDVLSASAGAVRDHLSVTDAGGDGSMAFNRANGVFTYTGPSAAEARAHFSAGDGMDVANGVFSLDIKADQGLIIDSTELSLKLEVNGGLEIDGTSKGLALKAAVAGNGLGFSAPGILSASVDNSSIEVSADAMRVKALGITNAMLAGSIVSTRLLS